MTKNSMKVIGRNSSQDRFGSEERRGGAYEG
jgi:hypothetical protein